ncbi:hypothetical protein [Ectobacillus funiculus]|jgi:hypothetical protein|uniref:hypothetical protein n=1 Tax=Ectobacillus funiculus TaxID=137993 RepID=UPI00196A48FE|nr:hypothetical protein [Ectobacillus funiculus]
MSTEEIAFSPVESSYITSYRGCLSQYFQLINILYSFQKSDSQFGVDWLELVQKERMQRAILLFKTTDVNVLSAYVVISGLRNSPERFSLKM